MSGEGRGRMRSEARNCGRTGALLPERGFTPGVDGAEAASSPRASRLDANATTRQQAKKARNLVRPISTLSSAQKGSPLQAT